MGRKTNKQRRAVQSATAREKAAAARAIQRRKEQRRRALLILTSVVAIAALGAVIALVAINHKTKSTSDRAAAPAAVTNGVASVQPATFDTVKQGSATLSLKPINDPPLTVNGKPDILYVGGEFCPFCAAERWSLATALSRFGKLSGVSDIHSAVDDGNVPTLSFYKSSYTSQYVAFTPREIEDRAQKPLEKLTSAQNALFEKYTHGTFPFIDIGGKYYQGAAGFDYTLLQGKTQQQIASQLNDPTSTIGKAVDGEANNLTAAICKVTNNQPSSVCSAAAITAIQSKLNG